MIIQDIEQMMRLGFFVLINFEVGWCDEFWNSRRDLRPDLSFSWDPGTTIKSYQT